MHRPEVPKQCAQLVLSFLSLSLSLFIVWKSQRERYSSTLYSESDIPRLSTARAIFLDSLQRERSTVSYASLSTGEVASCQAVIVHENMF